MTFYFVDTSALVKRYHLEAGSSKVASILTEPGSSHLISRLALVEAISAFALKVREGRIQMTDFALYRKRIFADVRNRTLSVIRMRAWHFKLADQLLQKHGMTSKLRTLDSLQLATALDLRARAMLDHFVSADVSLCKIASDEGLSVINPEAQ
jgi:predicted nucleic acid-binding protein